MCCCHGRVGGPSTEHLVVVLCRFLHDKASAAYRYYESKLLAFEAALKGVCAHMQASSRHHAARAERRAPCRWHARAVKGELGGLGWPSTTGWQCMHDVPAATAHGTGSIVHREGWMDGWDGSLRTVTACLGRGTTGGRGARGHHDPPVPPPPSPTHKLVACQSECIRSDTSKWRPYLPPQQAHPLCRRPLSARSGAASALHLAAAAAAAGSAAIRQRHAAACPAAPLSTSLQRVHVGTVCCLLLWPLLIPRIRTAASLRPPGARIRRPAAQLRQPASPISWASVVKLWAAFLAFTKRCWAAAARGPGSYRSGACGGARCQAEGAAG